MPAGRRRRSDSSRPGLAELLTRPLTTPAVGLSMTLHPLSGRSTRLGHFKRCALLQCHAHLTGDALQTLLQMRFVILRILLRSPIRPQTLRDIGKRA